MQGIHKSKSYHWTIRAIGKYTGRHRCQEKSVGALIMGVLELKRSTGELVVS
jgi:hypothetical protein